MVEVKSFDSEKFCGYKQMTTFYRDFGIAEIAGVKAVIGHYTRCINAWKYNYKYLTELVLVLNWKIAEHYGHNDELAKVYDDLWRKAERYAVKNLHGKEKEYYFDMTEGPEVGERL